MAAVVVAATRKKFVYLAERTPPIDVLDDGDLEASMAVALMCQWRRPA